jgi:uncharacterized protein YeaO (DUF488 family)
VAIHIVRLGLPRSPDEGLRIGTVRRPPRGVPKSEFASRDYYDVWYPNLAPTEELRKEGLAAQDAKSFEAYAERFRAQMAQPEASHTLDLLAALSHTANFAIGCYCEDERRCHRSLLREILAHRGALIVGGSEADEIAALLR